MSEIAVSQGDEESMAIRHCHSIDFCNSQFSTNSNHLSIFIPEANDAFPYAQ